MASTCDVTVNNFCEKLPEIQSAIKNAKFIALDTEFSALHPLKDQLPSLFDNPDDRYVKLKNNLEHIIPMQIGITAFYYNANQNSYTGKVFNFYICPPCFPTLDKSFCFETSTLEFFVINNFSFDKFARESIPYVSKQNLNELRKRLLSGKISLEQCQHYYEAKKIINDNAPLLEQWKKSSKVGSKLILPKVMNQIKGNRQLTYFIQKYYRSNKNLWTDVVNNEFVVYLKSEEELKGLRIGNNLEENLLSELEGFTKVFQYLVDSKKPVVAHNFFHDLLLLIKNFYGDLPNKYKDFKHLAHELFPHIYDTKSMCYEIKHKIPEDKRYLDTSLKVLFEYFKDGNGRHLALNSPPIEVDHTICGRYHEAGWDSFCAGYIFIRLAYYNIHDKYPRSKQIVYTELLASMSYFKNKVNMIRGSRANIQIDGDDPASSRPPWLVIESTKPQAINLLQVQSLLNNYGSVEVKKFSHTDRQALVAVDNFGSAKRILRTFNSHEDYQIRQYSVFKHSPLVRVFLLGGVTFSGALLIWLSRR